MGYKKGEMVPRDGHTFRVLIGARISGCSNQKKQSIEDQIANCKTSILLYYMGKPVEVVVVKAVAKGERLDRDEISELIAALRTSKYDLLIVEDLGRLLRDVTAKQIFGIACDHGTRAVSINDGVDTFDSTWETDALNACADHVAHNRNTSKRIHQKTMNRFLTLGELFQKPIPGYERYKHDGLCDMKLLPQWTAVILNGANKLLAGATDTAVGEYFDSVGFLRDPRDPTKKWQGKNVREFYRNSMLMGRPFRGARKSEKKYELGRRTPVKNPNGPKFIDRPELAHIGETMFLLLKEHYDKKAQMYRRAQNGIDSLIEVPRSRSRYPGRASFCYYCGFDCVWGANGQADNLMCNGARQHNCWCSFGVDGRRVTREMLKLIDNYLINMSGLKEQFAEMLSIASQDRRQRQVESPESLQTQLAEVVAQQMRVADGIAASGGAAALYAKLSELESAEKLIKAKIEQIRIAEQEPLELPETLDHMMTEIRKHLLAEIDSYELAEVLRKMTKSLFFYAVRLLDGTAPFMRARVTLDLAAPWVALKKAAGETSPFIVTHDFALFSPPQREAIREQVVAMRGRGMTERAVAKQLNVTIPAASRAMKLHRMMTTAGLASPYVLATDPEQLSTKYRRHRHRKYEFRPRDGYVPPSL